MKRISSGIKGLDEMLGGGFIEGRVILVCGGPGAGKTIFSMQYLMEAVRRGETGVYVTLEEPLKFINQNVTAFGWDLEEQEKSGLLKTYEFEVNSYSGEGSKRRDKHRGEMRRSILDDLVYAVSAVDAKHVVIDPITSIIIHEPRAGMKRFVIGQLFEKLRELDCTSVFTCETIPKAGDFYLEEFLADGVIRLTKDIQDYNLVKTIRIEKMRGINFDEQPRRYIINNKGFQVFNNEPVLI